MHLDALTFMVANLVATAFACAYLLGAWFMYKRPRLLLWWWLANSINTAGLSLLSVGFAQQYPPFLIAATGSMSIVPAMMWTGIQSFNGRQTSFLMLSAAPVIWAALSFAPFNYDHQVWPTLICFAVMPIFLSLSVMTLWRTRAENLHARWPLMGLLILHSVVFLGACYQLISGTFPFTEPPILGSWFGMVHFEGIFFAVGSAIFVASMHRGRLEHKLVQSANVDGLTGATNRNAFFEGAARSLERSRRDGAPLSLIMFDLDHFKRINDTQGHQAGDRILASFAETVRASLRPNDLFGRYGGEEFMVILPDASIETAYVVAERVRKAFADKHKFLDGVPLDATVSAGVASVTDSFELNKIISSVDRAMYAAKQNGRNRVECAATRDVVRTGGVIAKIA